MLAKIKRAVIPVAGIGTRMLPATKAIPKELLPVYDRPIIEHVVKEAIAGGVTEIIFVTRSGKEAIENHFDAHYELEHRLEKKGKEMILGTVRNVVPASIKISSVRQSDALGLGHAVLCAKHLLNNESFAVLLPDVLVLDHESRDSNYSFTQLVKAWDETGVGQVMVQRVNPGVVDSYGIANLGDVALQPFKSVALKGLVEKPSPDQAPSNLAVLGRYVLPSKTLDLLENTVAGVGGEIQLTDALVKLLDTDGLNALETDAEIHDCGNKQGFLSANLAVGMRDPETNLAIKKLFKSNGW
ncbi:UTP--glucose-1-phosphate uridylyltransferase [Porticoccaceae bacterium]|nr:UTP--glucose-1-phosphate uridylyltransferase [Porticoccaceae bacterium]MDB2382787.1 UTP--glucose-1-phosphate uridylyltransferase [Porticoccaceae bacterium]MDB2566041.1 UTP--glucose-1-phosphate uridylyltransferase [Porticoccaceae bacterium]